VQKPRAVGLLPVCLTVKPVGEPDAGDRHVRFDERGWETERCRMAQATVPILDSTISEELIRAGNVGIVAGSGRAQEPKRARGATQCFVVQAGQRRPMRASCGRVSSDN